MTDLSGVSTTDTKPHDSMFRTSLALRHFRGRVFYGVCLAGSLVGILLLIVLGFFRITGGFDPNTKYSPAKYEDGELKPAENK